MQGTADPKLCCTKYLDDMVIWNDEDDDAALPGDPIRRLGDTLGGEPPALREPSRRPPPVSRLVAGELRGGEFDVRWGGRSATVDGQRGQHRTALSIATVSPPRLTR